MRSTVSFLPVPATNCARAGAARNALAARNANAKNIRAIFELRMDAGLPIKAAHSILPRSMKKPGKFVRACALLNRKGAREEAFQRACSNCAVEAVEDSRADFFRAIRKAPMVTASESAKKDPSRKNERGPPFSPGPKHPQLISSPRA